MHDDAAIALAAAIIRQAIVDYMKAKPWQRDHAELIAFFQSSPLVDYAGINADQLIRDMNKQKLLAVKKTAK